MDCTAKGIAMMLIMGGWLHGYPGGIGRIEGVAGVFGESQIVSANYLDMPRLEKASYPQYRMRYINLI